MKQHVNIKAFKAFICYSLCERAPSLAFGGEDERPQPTREEVRLEFFSGGGGGGGGGLALEHERVVCTLRRIGKENRRQTAGDEVSTAVGARGMLEAEARSIAPQLSLESRLFHHSPRRMYDRMKRKTMYVPRCIPES